MEETKVIQNKKISNRLNENGTYNSKPLDPQYFVNYYQAHLKDVKIPFPYCGILTLKVQIYQHNRSQKCINNQK